MFKFSWRTEKVYILPTRLGLVLFLTGATLLTIGLTYSNNIIILNALGFLIFCIFSSITTHFNLFGVTLVSLSIDNNHADSPVKINGTLKNKTTKFRQNIGIKITTGNHQTILVTNLNLQPQVTTSFECFTLCLPRGRYEIKKVNLFTAYPLGIFQAWLYPERSFITQSFYIYPEAKGDANLKFFQKNLEQDLSNGQIMDINEFLFHEIYFPGIPYSRIDWKIYAKKNILLTKKFSYEHVNWGYSLDLEKSNPDVEQELKKLSKLIGVCHQYNLIWRLTTPTLKTGYNLGYDHYQKCMKELAVYGK